MSIINFSMEDFDGNVYEVNSNVYTLSLNRKQGISYWFYIPTEIIYELKLAYQDRVYFYVVQNKTAVISFRNPYRVRVQSRKIGFAGRDRRLCVVLPKRLFDKEFLASKKKIQLLSLSDTDTYEWQIRFL